MRTKITERLGIEHPIIQSGMSYAAYWPLVAAASEAGGLGILGAAPMKPAELRESIRKIREHTDKPFGVNILPEHPQAEEILDIMVEEKVVVASYGKGNPRRIIERCKPHGIFTMPTVGAVRHAIKAQRDGADAVIIQGTEAGGHTGYISTLVVLPLVAEAVEIPVVAAGGFCDGRGLVAALALGAEGIAMGTRFAITQECTMPMHVKQRYLNATENDTVITARVTGTRCRALNNKLTDLLGKGQGLSLKDSITGMLELKRSFNVPWWQLIVSGLKMKRAHEINWRDMAQVAHGTGQIKDALVDGDADFGFMPGGQVCGRINDIPTCKELIERIVNEAEKILEEINARIKPQIPAGPHGAL